MLIRIMANARLLGMRERAELLNGTLIVESTREQGTSIFIEIPLQNEKIAAEL